MAAEPRQPAADGYSTQQQPDGYVETPELQERIDRIGFILAAGATITFFLGFVFAYFYLRSLDNNELWRPAGVNPPDGWGIAITAAFVLSAVAFWIAAVAARRRRSLWIPAAGISLLLALAGCVLQAFEYANVPFGPESGGFASVFYGWTTLYVIVALLAMYRIETAFAVGVRNRRDPDYEPPVGFLSGAYYWALFAGIGVLAWILLYLV
jgi:heme/copper-type cytochrome/quinol oxidase subunit 3